MSHQWPRLEVVNTAGHLVRLGQEVGRGGEGSVFLIASDENKVAKI